MKVFFIGMLAFVLLSGQQCVQEVDTRNLYQKWYHSYEEDSAGVKAYRPDSYDFPPARGREGFEFKKDGEFIQYAIAPTDGNVALPGKWKRADAENVIKVELNKASVSSYRLEIIELKKDILKIRRLKE